MPMNLNLPTDLIRFHTHDLKQEYNCNNNYAATLRQRTNIGGKFITYF